MINLDSVKLTILPDSIIRHPNVSDSDYFGEKYADYVSNSSLKYINPEEGGSAHVYANRANNSTNSLELGTAVHRAVLEGDKYVLAEASKPSGKLAEVVEKAYQLYCTNPCRTYGELMLEAMMDLDYYGTSRTTARVDAAIEGGKEYYEHLLKAQTDCIILSVEQREKFLKAVASIKANKDIEALLNPSSGIFDVRSHSEDVLTGIARVEYEEDGLPVIVDIPIKCKIDNWSIDLDSKRITLNDLKTSSYAIQDFMGKWVNEFVPEYPKTSPVMVKHKFLPGSFQKWHYHRQMGMYAQMLALYCAKEYNIESMKGWTIEVNMIVAETISPYNAYSFRVTDDWLDAGCDELERLMGRLAWHKQHGFDKVIELDRATVETSN